MKIDKIKFQKMKNECIKLCPDKCLFVYSNVYKTKIMKNNDNSTKMIYWMTSQVLYIEKVSNGLLGTHIPIGRYCWRLVRLVCTFGHIHCSIHQTSNKIIKIKITR